MCVIQLCFQYDKVFFLLQNGQHRDHLQITLEIDGEDIVLDLVLNKQLIPKGFFHHHQENGEHKIYRPSAEVNKFQEYISERSNLNK